MGPNLTTCWRNSLVVTGNKYNLRKEFLVSSPPSPPTSDLCCYGLYISYYQVWGGQCRWLTKYPNYHSLINSGYRNTDNKFPSLSRPTTDPALLLLLIRCLLIDLLMVKMQELLGHLSTLTRPNRPIGVKGI